MKNYYEILEVSQNASQEVIEKAYKALVKKYHPDLQPNENKQYAENKIKLINEAYDILSNIEKKQKYDYELTKYKDTQEKVKNQQQITNYNNQKNNNSNQMQKRIIRQPKKISNSNNKKMDDVINEAYHNAYANAYNEAYINTLKNLGYKIRYKKSLKDYFRIILSALFTIVFISVFSFILWHIPPIKKWLIELYNSNEIIKILFDIIYKIIHSFLSLFFKK